MADPNLWTVSVSGEDGKVLPDVITGETFDEVMYYVERLDPPAWSYRVCKPDGDMVFIGEWLEDPTEARLIGDADPDVSAARDSFLDSDLASILLELGQNAHKDINEKPPAVISVIAMSASKPGVLADLSVQNYANEETSGDEPAEDIALRMMTSAIVHMASVDTHERQRVLRYLAPAFKAIREMTYEADS